MYSRPTGPRSIGGILDDAIRLYRESFRSVFPLLLVLSVLAVVPSLMLTLGGGNATLPAEQLRALMNTVTTPAYIGTTLVLWIVDLVLYAALFASIAAVANGSRLALGAALQLGLSRLLRMFGATILMVIALVVGFILLIIPAIYLSVSFQLVFVVLVLENAGVFASLRISGQLIKGYWWRSLALLSVAFIMVLVLSVLSGLVVGVLTVMKPTAGTVLAANQVVTVIVNMFLLGWIPSVLLAMYYDLKLRHEGGDLATRVDALAAS